MPPTFRVNIIHYNRPQFLLRLLKDLYRGDASDMEVVVYDDCTPITKMHGVLRFMEAHDVSLCQMPRRYGRDRHWELVTSVYRDQQDSGAAYFVHLPDDIRLCDDFLRRARKLWCQIEDPRKIALNLLRDLRYEAGCWTGQVAVPRREVMFTGWVDGLFFCERQFYVELGWRAPRPSDEWLADQSRGSGVYHGVSQYLHCKSLNLYGVMKSLVAHIPNQSQMHAHLRRDSPIEATSFIDGEASYNRLLGRGGRGSTMGE